VRPFPLKISSALENEMFKWTENCWFSRKENLVMLLSFCWACFRWFCLVVPVSDCQHDNPLLFSGIRLYDKHSYRRYILPTNSPTTQIRQYCRPFCDIKCRSKLETYKEKDLQFIVSLVMISIDHMLWLPQRSNKHEMRSLTKWSKQPCSIETIKGDDLKKLRLGQEVEKFVPFCVMSHRPGFDCSTYWLCIVHGLNEIHEWSRMTISPEMRRVRCSQFITGCQCCKAIWIAILEP
jgi:hypothetical protein